MMNREIAIDLDDLQGRLNCGIELVAVVQDCLDHAPNDPKCYSEALFGAVQYLRNLNDELTKLVAAAFGEIVKEEKE